MSTEIHEFRVTPVLSTSPAYTAADVLFDTTLLQKTVKKGFIRSVAWLDKDAQIETGTTIFLRSQVPLGTINAAISITDTNAEEIIGLFAMPASVQFVAARINYGLLELPFNIEGYSGLYVAAFTGSTGTHTASGIVVSVGIERRDA